MKRILKNPTSSDFLTNSYGIEYEFKRKSALTIDHPHADKIATELLYRYGFLQDITPKSMPVVETKTVMEPNKKGKIRPVVKKVVRQGKGVKAL